MPPRAAVSPASFPTRRSYAVLALAFMVFSVYASLLPFDLHRMSFELAWEQFRTTLATPMPSRVSRTDVLANVLLAVPVGYFLAATLLVDRARRITTLAAATMVIVTVSVVLSLSVEFLQVFTLDRVSSKSDVMAQTVGCIIGIAAWAIAGRPVTSWVRHTLAAAPGDRLSRLLTGYAFAWLFVSLAPFDITVDLGDLAERVRSGRINLIPFGALPSGMGAALWDAVAEILAAAPLGVLGLVGTGARRRSPSAALAFGIGLAAAVELAQVFIRSHAADVTDIFMSGIGVAAGVWIGLRVLQHPASAPARAAAASPTRLSWGACAMVVAWCVVLCLYHWQPYDFSVNGDLIRQKLSGMSLLPFAGHRGGSDLNALKDLLITLGLSAPLGGIAAFVWRGDGRHESIGTVVSLLMAAGIFTMVEFGQLFLPTRIPDPTDVLVGVLGAYAGIVMGRWVRAPLAGPQVNTRQRSGW